MIDQQPHTWYWDPNSGRYGRWCPDSTPSTGQHNDGAVPQANFGTPVDANAIVVDKPTPTKSPAECKLKIHLAITRLRCQFDAL